MEVWMNDLRKLNRIIAIMNRWLNGEISTDQCDRELKIAGVMLTGKNERENDNTGGGF